MASESDSQFSPAGVEKPTKGVPPSLVNSPHVTVVTGRPDLHALLKEEAEGTRGRMSVNGRTNSYCVEIFSLIQSFKYVGHLQWLMQYGRLSSSQSPDPLLFSKVDQASLCMLNLLVMLERKSLHD
jgi:hypothetical protein